MNVELLVAEIGSTTTVVNAFTDLTGDAPVFLGQGMAATSSGEGDVVLGLQRARIDLARNLGVNKSMKKKNTKDQEIRRRKREDK
jgi:hypothetical protein